MLNFILKRKTSEIVAKVKSFLDVKQHPARQALVFGLIFGLIGGFIIWHSLADTTTDTDTSSQATTATDIDYNDQSAVNTAYWSLWMPAQTEDPGWTGSVENCKPGTMSDTARQKEVDAINFARRL